MWYMISKKKNNHNVYHYVFKEKLKKTDVNEPVSTEMFIGVRDVIGHVTPYPDNCFVVSAKYSSNLISIYRFSNIFCNVSNNVIKR